MLLPPGRGPIRPQSDWEGCPTGPLPFWLGCAPGPSVHYKTRVPSAAAGFIKGTRPTSLVPQMVVLRARERTFWSKWPFRVHGSTGSAGRRALHFPGRKSDEHFTCTGSYFFLAARLAFGWGCPAGLGKGRLQGHPSRGQSAGSSVSRKREHTFCRKRVFRVHGNTGSAGQPEPRARPACKISCTSTTGWVSCGGWVDQPCFPSGCFT